MRPGARARGSAHRIITCGWRTAWDDLVDQRQPERGGLAGAGARLHQEVLALGDRVKHRGLHRGRCVIAHVVERELDVLVQRKVVEARGLRLRASSSVGRIDRVGRDCREECGGVRRTGLGRRRSICHLQKPCVLDPRVHPVGGLVGARSPDSPGPNDVVRRGRAWRHRGRVLCRTETRLPDLRRTIVAAPAAVKDRLSRWTSERARGRARPTPS